MASELEKFALNLSPQMMAAGRGALMAALPGAVGGAVTGAMSEDGSLLGGAAKGALGAAAVGGLMGGMRGMRLPGAPALPAAPTAPMLPGKVASVDTALDALMGKKAFLEDEYGSSAPAVGALAGEFPRIFGMSTGFPAGMLTSGIIAGAEAPEGSGLRHGLYAAGGHVLGTLGGHVGGAVGGGVLGALGGGLVGGLLGNAEKGVTVGSRAVADSAARVGRILGGVHGTQWGQNKARKQDAKAGKPVPEKNEKGSKEPKTEKPKSKETGKQAAFEQFGLEKDAVAPLVAAGARMALPALMNGARALAGKMGTQALIGGGLGAAQGVMSGEGAKGALVRGGIGAASGAIKNPFASAAAGIGGNMVADKIMAPKTPATPGM